MLRRVWIRQNVARAAWAAVLTVTAAPAVFLAAAEPTGGQPAPETAEWLSAGLVFGGAIAVLAVLGTQARLTSAPGLAFAVMAAGVTVLTRTAPQDLTPSAPARP